MLWALFIQDCLLEPYLSGDICLPSACLHFGVSVILGVWVVRPWMCWALEFRSTSELHRSSSCSQAGFPILIRYPQALFLCVNLLLFDTFESVVLCIIQCLDCQSVQKSFIYKTIIKTQPRCFGFCTSFPSMACCQWEMVVTSYLFI